MAKWPVESVHNRQGHRHVGKHLHHADVFQDLVGCTIFTQGQARVRCTDLDVFLRVSDALPNLIIHPAGGKVGKRPCEWHLAADGHPSRNAHHVGFCNANLEEAIGKGIPEGIHFQRTRQICA